MMAWDDNKELADEVYLEQDKAQAYEDFMTGCVSVFAYLSHRYGPEEHHFSHTAFEAYWEKCLKKRERS